MLYSNHYSPLSVILTDPLVRTPFRSHRIQSPPPATSSSGALRSPPHRRSPCTDRRLIYVIMRSYRDTRHYVRELWDGVYSKISVIIERMFHRPCALTFPLLLARAFSLPPYRDIPLTRLVSHYIFRTATFRAMMHKSYARIRDRCARSRARARWIYGIFSEKYTMCQLVYYYYLKFLFNVRTLLCKSVTLP